VLDVLRLVALPPTYAARVDAAVAAYGSRGGRDTKRATVRGLAERQTRINEMYELGRVDRATYDARSMEIAEQTKTLTAERPVPLFSRQRQTVSTIVDDWDDMTPEERKRLIAIVFAEIHAGAEHGVERLRPHDDWLPYMQAVIAEGADNERWGTERKTGFEPAALTLAR
jgi:dienelactone hydrolase